MRKEKQTEQKEEKTKLSWHRFAMQKKPNSKLWQFPFQQQQQQILAHQLFGIPDLVIYVFKLYFVGTNFQWQTK